ncbi:MAG: hypothetical protein ACQR33_05110 [Candidatus Saccharibacteria bacterium]
MSNSEQESIVETNLVDLSDVDLGEFFGTGLSGDETIGASKARLLSQIDDPASSFGGYNPNGLFDTPAPSPSLGETATAQSVEIKSTEVTPSDEQKDLL